MTQARNHTCAPLTTTHSPHHSHHTSQFLAPTKYHTWQFFPQLLHQQYCAIQEGHQRNIANKEGAKKGNRTTPKEVLWGNFGRYSKEGSCHYRTIPPIKEKAKQQDCSLFFLAQSAICKSHPNSLLQSNVQKYRGNWGGNFFPSTFGTSSDKTLIEGGCREGNLFSAR